MPAVSLEPRVGMSAADLLHAIVAIPSPTGQEEDVVRFLQAQARLDGFTVREDEAGNFIAERHGQGPHIAFVGHVDTVSGDIPVRIEEGELWGRGSVDAKGCLVAAYCAARDTEARITIVGAVDEEGTSRGARALDLEAPDFIINGEPSGSDGVTLGYKGIVRGTFRFETPAAHGGHPGGNALDLATAWWSDVAALHEGYGFEDITCRLDAIQGGTDVETICTGAFQIRVPPGTDVHWIAGQLPSDAGIVEVSEAWPAHMGDRRSPLATAFNGAIRHTGAVPRMLRKTGTSDMNVLAGRFDVPMVAYGPGDSSLDHTMEERLSLAELDEAVAVWTRVLETLAR